MPCVASTAAAPPPCQYARANQVNNAATIVSAVASPQRVGACVDAANRDAYRRRYRGRRRGGGAQQQRVHGDGPGPRNQGEEQVRLPPRVRAREGRKTARRRALQERLAALERERDQLKAELERFKARQRRLEETQAQVRDRIAWALDSLHNILEGKG